MSLHQNHLGCLLNSRLLAPTPDSDVTGLQEALEYAFLTSSQWMLLLWVWGPHFENSWISKNSKEVGGATGVLLLS